MCGGGGEGVGGCACVTGPSPTDSNCMAISLFSGALLLVTGGICAFHLKMFTLQCNVFIYLKRRKVSPFST